MTSRVTPATETRAATITLAGLLALAALRLVLIHTSLPDVLYWEEPYRLTIARELLDGPHLPLVEYQADHYQGGSLAVGLLAVPLIAVLGPTYETLKLVPLAFTLATAVLWTVILWRASGPVAAALGAWLLALAPPLAHVYQVHAMGSHAETAFFTAAGFLLTLRIVGGARGRTLPFLLGLVAGLGIWFCYTAATGVAACGLVWLGASPRHAVRRGLAPLLAGGVLGLLPWLAYNLAHGFGGLERLGELFDPMQRELVVSTEPLATRMGALISLDLPRALGFPDATPGLPGAAAWTYYALLTAAFGAVAWIAVRCRARGPEGSLATLIVAYIVIHLLVYVTSSLRIDVENGFIAYRFFAPLFPAAAGLLALALAHLLARGRRVLAVASLAVALAAGIYGTAGLLSEHRADDLLPLETGYKVMGLLTQLKYRHDIPRAIELLSRLDGEVRNPVFFGLGWGLEYQFEKDRDWPSLVVALAACQRPDDRSAALQGIRWSVRQREIQSRAYANAGFRTDDARVVHERLAKLALRLRTLDVWRVQLPAPVPG
jgi:hypothetical protein